MAVIEAIKTIYLEANVASVTFSSIPNTYEHLQLRCSGKSTRTLTSGYDNSKIQFNNDTGANWGYHYMFGGSTATTAGGGTASGDFYPPWWSNNSYASHSHDYGTNIFHLWDYANTNKWTTLTFHGGANLGVGVGTPDVRHGGAAWKNTAAVHTVKIQTYSHAFIRGSSFTLYGVNSS